MDTTSTSIDDLFEEAWNVCSVAEHDFVAGPSGVTSTLASSESSLTPPPSPSPPPVRTHCRRPRPRYAHAAWPAVHTGTVDSAFTAVPRRKRPRVAEVAHAEVPLNERLGLHRRLTTSEMREYWPDAAAYDAAVATWLQQHAEMTAEQQQRMRKHRRLLYNRDTARESRQRRASRNVSLSQRVVTLENTLQHVRDELQHAHETIRRLRAST